MNEGKFGWILVSSVVFVWDYWALKTKHQTMTSAFKKATQNPYGRVILTGIWGALTLHLFTESADPHQISRKLKKRYDIGFQKKK